MKHLALAALSIIPAPFALSAGMPVPSIYQPANAPQPLAPLPTPSQFRWHQQELQIFIHFGVNTFTGLGWGDGTENPDLFAPTDLAFKDEGYTMPFEWQRIYDAMYRRNPAVTIDMGGPEWWKQIEDTRAYPLISSFSLHFTSFIVKEAEEKKTGTREEKAI